MQTEHKIFRPFMTQTEEEPNIRFRPWLELNIGRQRHEWDWAVSSVKGNCLEIRFLRPEDAVLFELTFA